MCPLPEQTPTKLYVPLYVERLGESWEAKNLSTVSPKSFVVVRVPFWYVSRRGHDVMSRGIVDRRRGAQRALDSRQI